MKADTWNAALHGPLSESAIRELHRPADSHRVSSSLYEAGTQFRGAMRAGRVYVLAGHCAYSFQNSSVRLAAGEFCDLPQGGYEFQVLGNAACSVIRVWDLSGLSRVADRKLPH